MPISEEDRATLSAYLDGELDEATSQEVEARLNLEPEVRAEYESLRHTWSLLDYLPRAAPGVDFTSRTLERLANERRVGLVARFVRRVPAPLVWAAAALLVFGIGFAVAGGLSSGGPQTTPEADEALERHLRVIERWPLYQHADDLEFLRKLDDPELFGDEPGP